MRPIKDCKAIIICHGKSEKILFDRIATCFGIKVIAWADKKGNKSIEINSVRKILQRRDFKQLFKNKFSSCKFDNMGNPLNLRIFFVLDKDSTSDDEFRRYLNHELFSRSWLKKVLVPIYNDECLESTLKAINWPYECNHNHKARFYNDLFRKRINKVEDVKNLADKLSTIKCTNMEKVLYYILETYFAYS